MKTRSAKIVKKEQYWVLYWKLQWISIQNISFRKKKFISTNNRETRKKRLVTSSKLSEKGFRQVAIRNIHQLRKACDWYLWNRIFKWDDMNYTNECSKKSKDTDLIRDFDVYEKIVICN